MRFFKYILVFISLFNFTLEISYSNSILIEGGVENIVLLANTEYLKGTPVIFFSAQLKERTVEIIDKIDVVIVTGDDPDFFKTAFQNEKLVNKVRIIYMLKSNKEEVEETKKRLRLEEFNLFNQKQRQEISSNERKEGQENLIEYSRINSTRYLVKMEASESFWLVFSDSFDAGWEAYIRREALAKKNLLKENDEPWSALINAWKDRGKKIELKDHFIVNGYANSWWVPVEANSSIEKSKKKSFEIILEYKPQILFEVGLLISFLTLIFCISYPVYEGIKKLKLKKLGKS